MTDLTPTPKQLQYWIDKICYPHEQGVGPSLKDKELACLAFKAGADEELEACLERILDVGLADQLRTARRPKPPSLKEQALAALDDAVMRGDCITISDALPTLRKALEAL
jgi:hypothetical protein